MSKLRPYINQRVRDNVLHQIASTPLRLCGQRSDRPTQAQNAGYGCVAAFRGISSP
jgi:hypothetical protein